MIAMQYTIRLAGDYGADRIRERAEVRAPLFQGMDGLIHKSYLFNEEEAIYAPFYVWSSDDAGRAFLTSDLFRDVVETFGRPRIRTWNVLAFGARPNADRAAVAAKELDSIAAEEDLSRLAGREIRRNEELMKLPGLCFHLTALDADRWELMRYSAWCDRNAIRQCDSDMVETFEILQLSRPAVTA